MHHPAGPSDAAASDQFAGSEDVTVEPQPSGLDPSGEIPWGEIATNSGVATNGGGGNDRELDADTLLALAQTTASAAAWAAGRLGRRLAKRPPPPARYLVGTPSHRAVCAVLAPLLM